MSKNRFEKQFFRQIIITFIIQVVSAAAEFALLYFDSYRNMFGSSFYVVLLLLLFSEYSAVFIAGCIIAVVINVFLTLKSTSGSGRRVIMALLMPTNFTYPLLLLLALLFTQGKILEFLGSLRQTNSVK